MPSAGRVSARSPPRSWPAACTSAAGTTPAGSRPVPTVQWGDATDDLRRADLLERIALLGARLQRRLIGGHHESLVVLAQSGPIPPHRRAGMDDADRAGAHTDGRPTVCVDWDGRRYWVDSSRARFIIGSVTTRRRFRPMTLRSRRPTPSGPAWRLRRAGPGALSWSGCCGRPGLSHRASMWRTRVSPPSAMSCPWSC